MTRKPFFLPLSMESELLSLLDRNRNRNGQYDYRDLSSYRSNPTFAGVLNYEPYIRQFLVSSHITFYRTPDLQFTLK